MFSRKFCYYGHNGLKLGDISANSLLQDCANAGSVTLSLTAFGKNFGSGRIEEMRYSTSLPK
jgi:hypothetical protein